MTSPQDPDDQPDGVWAEGQAPPEAEAPPEVSIGEDAPPAAMGDERPATPTELDDAGIDAAFADIVARWRAEAGRETPPGASPNQPGRANRLDDLGRVADPDRAEPPDRPAGTPAERRDRRDDARRDDRSDSDQRIEREIDFAVDGPSGGHFVPPDPAPLPRLDLITLFAWVAVLAGPIFLLIAALLRDVMPEWTLALAVAATIGGFVVLASRLPRRGDNDPDDDGAVV